MYCDASSIQAQESVLRFELRGLRRDQAEYHRFAARYEAPWFKATGAVVVEDADRFLRDTFVAAFSQMVAAIVGDVPRR
jgi:hypothetical protein